jgi:hypothetical protein
MPSQNSRAKYPRDEYCDDVIDSIDRLGAASIFSEENRDVRPSTLPVETGMFQVEFVDGQILSYNWGRVYHVNRSKLLMSKVVSISFVPDLSRPTEKFSYTLIPNGQNMFGETFYMNTKGDHIRCSVMYDTIFRIAYPYN